VVVPWLIGRYTGGTRAPRPQLFAHIAEQLWTLMTRELGYARFGAVGGDGGSVLAQLLGVSHPDQIIGIHLTDLGFSRAFGQFPDLSEAELRYFADQQAWGMREGAYAMVQGTKPQTLAFALNDSPVGFAAWIIEKFHGWSDCDGNLECVYTKDELLTNVMLYWLNEPTARSVSYREEFTAPSLAPDQKVGVPSALAVPPKDPGRSRPGSWPSATSPTCGATPSSHTAATSSPWSTPTSWPPTCGRSSPSYHTRLTRHPEPRNCGCRIKADRL
jgi:pimeloyl-ACP methyl ester carboxylesterase